MKSALLIDDEPELLELLEYLFKQLNYGVISFPHAISVEAIKQLRPSLIILDHHLGQKSGGDLCKELKVNPATQNIPVLMLSSDENIAEIARDNCAEDYLLKPFDIGTLHATVKRITKLKSF